MLPNLHQVPSSKLPPATFIRGGFVLMLVGATAAALARYVLSRLLGLEPWTAKASQAERENWRMPPLATLPAPKLTLPTRVWMGVLRCYLVMAVLLLAWVVQTAFGG